MIPVLQLLLFVVIIFLIGPLFLLILVQRLGLQLSGSDAARQLCAIPPEGSGYSAYHPIQGSTMVWRAVPEGIELRNAAPRTAGWEHQVLLLTPSAAWRDGQKLQVWGYRFRYFDQKSSARFKLLGVLEDGNTFILFQTTFQLRVGWLAFRDALRDRGLLGPTQLAGAVEEVPPALQQGFPRRLR